jgi:hypothetical protein
VSDGAWWNEALPETAIHFLGTGIPRMLFFDGCSHICASFAMGNWSNLICQLAQILLRCAMQIAENELIRTRTTLINRLKNWQDQASWQEFFDGYWKLIYAFAVKSGLTRTEAQDVVQETMFSVAKHMPNFKYDRRLGSFKAWLMNQARWRISDQFRKRTPVCHSRSHSDD